MGFQEIAIALVACSLRDTIGVVRVVIEAERGCTDVLRCLKKAPKRRHILKLLAFWELHVLEEGPLVDLVPSVGVRISLAVQPVG